MGKPQNPQQLIGTKTQKNRQERKKQLFQHASNVVCMQGLYYCNVLPCAAMPIEALKNKKPLKTLKIRYLCIG